MIRSILASHLGGALALFVAGGIAMLGCGASATDAQDQPATNNATISSPSGELLEAGSPPDTSDASTDASTGATGRDAATPYDGGPNPCAPLAYPSGVRIQTFEDAATTASYAKHLPAGQKAPTCFLDTDNLVNADNGQVLPITVQVSAHFQLDELVGTEVSQGYGHFVLMRPEAVAALEKFRDTLNVPVSVISGFRSPRHQEDVCNSLCGNPLGCNGTCANNSRHMFGDAFDLPLDFYTTPDEHTACNSGFKFAYKESGTHLHIDQNPAYASCVIQ
jgi:hypothetical protein